MNYEYEGYSPLATDDAPEVFYPPMPREEHEREVDAWLSEHYDDGVNFGGEG